jgi:hypothetical protein
MRSARCAAAASLVALSACAMPGSGPGCAPLGQPVALPPRLDESSGVAVSRAHPGVFWTHIDGEARDLFAVDSSGTRAARVRLAGASPIDAEDIAIGECGGRDCLYLADTGDNDERRRTLRIFRVPEPDPRADSVARAEAFTLTLPSGPRDIEALFVLPGERIHLVTKGRNHAVSVYRLPGALDAGSANLAEEVQRLGETPRALPRQVTGASASPDGGTVVVRTYELVTFYRVDADTLVATGDPLNLRPLREPQGEGIGVGEDGLIALTSEAGPIGSRGSLSLVRCEL